MLILTTELKDGVPDETWDVLRSPDGAKKHLDLLYVFDSVL